MALAGLALIATVNACERDTTSSQPVTTSSSRPVSTTQLPGPPPRSSLPPQRTHTNPAPTEPPTASDGSAGAALALVAVKGRAPSTGYDRDRFGSAWTDDNDDAYGHNGCDTRNDILRRDLIEPVIEAGTNGCVVLIGTLPDPYTATSIHFVRGEATSSLVQIDHVVALGDAWQTGAQFWTDTKRQNFANDPLNLLAVDGSTNESKGDGDAATWLPPSREFRCRYVARQTAVKAKYGLWMTAAEQAATQRILVTCPGQPLPTGVGPLHPMSSITVTGHPSPSLPPTTAPPTTAPAGNCEPGYSPCLRITDDLDCDDIDDSLKPIHVTGADPYRLDDDDDGYGCES